MAKINRRDLKKFSFREQKSRHAQQEFGPGRREYIICPDGGEAYFHKSWHHSLVDFSARGAMPAGPLRRSFSEASRRGSAFGGKHLSGDKKLSFKLCPFHQMVKNKQYEGEVVIENVPVKNRQELVRLIERSGEHGYRRDPMDRIIKIETKGDSLRVETSENQLAQKIANKIRDRFKKTNQEVRREKRNSDVVSVKIIFSKII
ncbi:MAG: hypothetical protein HYW90_03145 [Candidatus Sungbacteria bacterium]|nr:hypothetical protein [Candidatus Sungbacteria bacterium]